MLDNHGNRNLSDVFKELQEMQQKSQVSANTEIKFNKQEETNNHHSKKANVVHHL